MTFKELINHLSVEQVNTWWEELHRPGLQKQLEPGWKYYLKKDGNVKPFKSAIRDLCKTYNVELNSFSSDDITRNSFCEKFDFEIEEELVFHQSELRNLNALYGKIKHKTVFRDFLHYANSVVTLLNIDAYKIRMGIRSTTAMVIIGMRGVLYYTEKNGNVFINLILSNSFWDSVKSNYPNAKVMEFERIGQRSFVQIQINQWNNLDIELLNNNREQIKEEFDYVKNKKIAKWNQEAKTTNSALKFLIFKNPDIDTFLTAKHNFELNTEDEMNNNPNKLIPPLNQILYGPPGTGKTYSTISKALEIINEAEEKALNWSNRKDVKDRYNKRIEEGRIVFTTFHQSMSYEDFIEGIKPLEPKEDEDFVKYDVVPGILKKLCDRARNIEINNVNVNWDEVDFYKMAVGGRNRLDLHDWCIANNVVGLGWGGKSDLTKFNGIKSWNEFRDLYSKEFPELVNESKYNITSSYTFQKMKINDIVVVSKGNLIIDAIGVIKGEYYFDDKNETEFCHFRKVEWIAKDMNSLPERFFKKKISQQTIYQFYNEDVKIDAFKQLAGSDTGAPYVLIIDEINRGNISQIFGELITLIEDDKRAGKPEALEVILPYSKEQFSVPSNIHIIGTMNTADRSVEALDTALRRRFVFEELSPNPSLIATEGLSKNTQGVIEGVDMVKMLFTINKRIELLLDKDHQIGHAFFLNLDTIEGLKSTFKQKIIPLLQEYFYGDIGKICLVLGDSFIRKSEEKGAKLFASKKYDSEIRTEYEAKPIYNIEIADNWDFKSIYESAMN